MLANVVRYSAQAPQKVAVTSLVPGHADAQPTAAYGTMKELWWSSVRWPALRKNSTRAAAVDRVRPSIP